MYQEEYKRWMAADLEDADLMPELTKIEGNDDEIKERFAVALKFGTAGLRGVLGAGTNRMNKYTVTKATQGLANYIKLFQDRIFWTSFRNSFLVAGVLIVFMYEKIGRQDGGTNQVLATIKSKDDVPFLSAPLIFVSTLLTHLTGGSAGREGASIQFGGSIGNWLGKLAHLDEFDHHVMIMCGMSAAFAAVFGTPMAAAVFAMEVVSVGVMYYAALLPCVIAAIIAAEFATGMGIDPETFPVHSIPGLTVETGLKMALIAVGCGILSILFCILLKTVGQLYTKYLKNPYIRIVVAAGVIILLTICLNTKDYMGAGSGLIARAIEKGEARPLDFLWKMLLTALTMRAGYRGGEIVPAFSIGATFGCVAGGILGFSPELAAAASMVALFCGVTNCPITAMLISFELFGFSGAAYYLIAISISYAVSGYYSLYKDQTIVYSKYKARYINRKTR